MSTNAFRELQALLQPPRVVVGIVTEVHADDTCTVQLPGPGDLSGYAANVFTGSLIQARGSTVPVGKRAFVRDWQTGWVIETQAPDAPAVDVPIGTVALPPPPDPPPPSTSGTNNVLTYRGTTGGTQYLPAYQVRNPGAVGLGGGFASATGWTVSGDTFTATVNTGSTGGNIFGDTDVLTKSAGYYAVEIVVTDIKTGSTEPPQLGSHVTKASALGDYFVAGYDNSYPGFYTNGAFTATGTDPTEGSTDALVIGDVIGIVYHLTNRNAAQGCLVDIYKNGTLEVHGTLLPQGEDPTLWTLGLVGAYW